MDLSKLDLNFAEKPKSKKVPQLIMSAGKIYVNAAVFDSIFRNLLSDFVTLMPLTIDGEPHYIIRPDVVIDCVDEVRSEWRQRDDGYRYSWPSLALADVPETAPPVFRPGHGSEFWSQPVFSELFVELCRKNKVVGAVFEEVYPLSDGSGILLK